MSKGLIINEDVWYLIEDLNQKEKCELLDCLAAYHRGEELPIMSRIVKATFSRIALDNDRFAPDRKSEISLSRSEAGRKGAAARWGEKITNDGKSVGNEWQNGKDGKNSKIRKEEIRKDKIRAEENIKEICPLFEHEEVVTAWREWVDMRKQIKKPMVGQAESRAISNLMNLSGGDPSEAVKILNQSTDKCWIGLFALRHDWKDKGKDVFDEWAKA